GRGPGGDAGIGGDRRLGRLPVGGVVILAAQPVVVYPRLVRDAGVERRLIVPAGGSPRASLAAEGHGTNVAKAPARIATRRSGELLRRRRTGSGTSSRPRLRYGTGCSAGPSSGRTASRPARRSRRRSSGSPWPARR